MMKYCVIAGLCVVYARIHIEYWWWRLHGWLRWLDLVLGEVSMGQVNGAC